MSTLKNKKVRFGYNGGDGRDWRQVLCVELKTRGGCGGGGGPYQVSAGRQKEEAASTNMELDMT